eukprot:1973908-Amphidinium_carterae.1
MSLRGHGSRPHNQALCLDFNQALSFPPGVPPKGGVYAALVVVTGELRSLAAEAEYEEALGPW